jgi:Tfp pilus assembly protein PilN
MGARRINLLPIEERQKVSRERGLVYALLALIVVVAILGALYVFEAHSKSSKETELANLNSQIAQLNQQIAVLKPYEQQQAQRVAMSQSATQIYDSRITWSSILDEISLLIPETCQLTQLSGSVPASMLAGSALSGFQSGASGTADLTLAGEAVAQRDVAEFMTRLGLMPQIQNIQLVSAQKGSATDTGEANVTFTITASLRPFQAAPPLAVPASATTTGGGQ